LGGIDPAKFLKSAKWIEFEVNIRAESAVGT
jgi:hypothetical protein